MLHFERCFSTIIIIQTLLISGMPATFLLLVSCPAIELHDKRSDTVMLQLPIWSADVEHEALSLDLINSASRCTCNRITYQRVPVPGQCIPPLIDRSFRLCIMCQSVSLGWFDFIRTSTCLATVRRFVILYSQAS